MISKKVKLEDIANIVDSLHSTPNYSSTGYSMVRVTDIKEGFLNLDNCLKVSEDTYLTFSRKYKAKEGDIVFSRVGSEGIPSLVKKDQVFCLGQNTVFIVPREDNNWLYYWLTSRAGKEQIQKHTTGTTQKTISLESIKNLELSLPPLSSQHRISNILSSFDNKIELLRKENNTLENIAQSIFKEWFVNTKEKQIEISNLIEFNPQLSIRKKQSASYIEMADLFTNSSSISKIVKRPYTSGSKFQNNDILFARVTPCLENGKTGIVKGLGSEDIGWGSTEFIVMRGKDSITYPFVYCLARNKQFRQFAQKEMIGTSGRQRVPVNKLQGYLIPQPTTKKLDSFNQISLLIFERIEKNSIKAGILIKMKNNLLSKFFKE